MARPFRAPFLSASEDAVTELDLPREQLSGTVLQAGKRRFVRLNEAV